MKNPIKTTKTAPTKAASCGARCHLGKAISKGKSAAGIVAGHVKSAAIQGLNDLEKGGKYGGGAGLVAGCIAGEAIGCIPGLALGGTIGSIIGSGIGVSHGIVYGSGKKKKRKKMRRWLSNQFGAPYDRPSLGHILGIYLKDGRLRLGRAPYLREDEWARIENPSLRLRILQRVGLAYAPDHTRPGLFFTKKTKD